HQALLDLLHANASQRCDRWIIHTASRLPTLGALEVPTAEPDTPRQARLVLNTEAALDIAAAVRAVDRTEVETLALAWRLVERIVSLVAFPYAPTDRFTAKIDVVARMTYV